MGTRIVVGKLGDMDAQAIVRRLSAFPRGLEQVVLGVTEGEARWKPPSGAWSILEVVCHLGDEEVLDFRARVFRMLLEPGVAWEPTDPEGWARDRKYNDQDLGAALARFVREREDSVRQLRDLGDLNSFDWSQSYQHPRIGPIPAGELFVSWCAHDALHLRQIAKRLFELSQRDGSPYKTAYAGEWVA